MEKGVQLILVEGEDKSSVNANANKIVAQWLRDFEAALAKKSLELSNLFAEDSWLKDALTLSWDLRTLQGISKITEYVRQHNTSSKLFNLNVSRNSSLRPALKEMGPAVWLESAFNFDTDVGKGRGVLRLVNVALGEWKAWTVFLRLEELKGYPQRKGVNRHRFRQHPLPVPQEFNDENEPTVVIIGAGHCGLTVAACLQDLGVRTLIIDREQRIGDSWRNRYKRLKLHSPNWADNMPFLDFPTNWPVFPDKTQMADFLQFYAQTLDLQIWLRTEFKSAKYDDDSGRWTIETVTDEGKKRSLHPRHLVYAGNAHVLRYPNVPTFPGQDEFKGLLYHAAEHIDAMDMPNVRGKKVVVIGAATTAHDVCQDFLEAGADVTMIQRHSTFVFSNEAAIHIALPPGEDDLTSEDFMLNQQSLPTLVMFRMMRGVTAHMLQYDSQIIEALDKTEFSVAKGEDGESFLSRGLTRRGGFYVNDGTSDSIACRRIRVMRCAQGVEKLTGTGLVLADGRSTDADIIVLATGWKSFEDVREEIMGEEVTRRTNRGWGLDDEGELGSVYRPTGHPGFWVAISNFFGSRAGGPLLALQIKAREEGLNPAPT